MSQNKRAPAFFAGHGNPMNAIENNEFTRSLNSLGKSIEKPKAILAISAHWYVPYAAVSVHESDELMYDMFGFPDKLYEVEYKAENSDFLISKLQLEYEYVKVENRGLDHGVWSILVHLFPDADIPVTQISINSNLSLKEHYELGRRLSVLRDEGVMIIASGNVTHNLREVNWASGAKAESWAVDFDRYIADAIVNKDFESLIDVTSPYFNLAHPTIEHYIPLLYIAGAMNDEDESSFTYEGIELGTMSMRNWLVK
ncbi:4,5-DOPA dioxygenase extradiol [Sulfurimonas sp.]|uniref:4,5-DOPA-extradiol-dioxygenase n=1 Tax=Sulfurimonas sp. TaxID=2022749 RepID=UPI00356528C4